MISGSYLSLMRVKEISVTKSGLRLCYSRNIKLDLSDLLSLKLHPELPDKMAPFLLMATERYLSSTIELVTSLSNT